MGGEEQYDHSRAFLEQQKRSETPEEAQRRRYPITIVSTEYVSKLSEQTFERYITAQSLVVMIIYIIFTPKQCLHFRISLIHM